MNTNSWYDLASEEIQSPETTSERYFKVPAVVEPPSPTDRIIPSNTTRYVSLLFPKNSFQSPYYDFESKLEFIVLSTHYSPRKEYCKLDRKHEFKANKAWVQWLIRWFRNCRWSLPKVRWVVSQPQHCWLSWVTRVEHRKRPASEEDSRNLSLKPVSLVREREESRWALLSSSAAALATRIG